MRKFFIFLLVASPFLFSSCSKKEEKKAVPQEAPVEVFNPEKPTFVEIVQEISTLPLKERSISAADLPENLNGYIFDKRDFEKKFLYPSSGNVPPVVDKIPLWVGYRVTDLVSHPWHKHQLLLHSEKNKLSFDTAKTPSMQRLLYSVSMFAIMRIATKVDVKIEKEGAVSISASGKKVKLKPGEEASLVIQEKKIKVKDLIKEIQKEWKKAKFSAEDVKTEDLESTFKAVFRNKKEAKFYIRISAVNHGNIQVSDYDVLKEWERSEAKLLDGPYQEALDAIEKVIIAAPEFRAATERWALAHDLVEKGIKPSSLSGTLRFPPGMPNKKQKAIFKKYHEGIVALANPKDPQDFARASAPIEKGKFKIPVPKGEYRLTVHVPGFQVFQQAVTIDGKTDVNVQLQAK